MREYSVLVTQDKLKKKFTRPVLLWLGLVAVLLVLFGSRLEILMSAEKTQGSFERHTSFSVGYRGNYSRAYKPIYFYEVNGLRYQIEGISNTFASSNEDITILYNPDYPSKAWIYSFSGFWLVPCVTAFFIYVLYAAVLTSFLNVGYHFNLGWKGYFNHMFHRKSK